MPSIIPLSPRQTFDDNMRPAHLLLRVYRLLDSNDKVTSEGEMVSRMRAVASANADEQLLLIYNDLFLGLVRERADVTRAHLLERSLTHLLRQAVVTSCTALEAYLAVLLRANLPTVVRIRGRNFLPAGDTEIQGYFKDMSFGLEEVLRLVDEPEAADRIANKMLGYINYSYLSSKKGIHIAGVLLGVEKPWAEIATHLAMDRKELIDTLEKTVDRRNDIMHRADRSKDDPGGEPQGISYIRTRHMIDTIDHICVALNDLVEKRMADFTSTANNENPNRETA